MLINLTQNYDWTYRKSNTFEKIIRASMNIFHRVPNESIDCNSGDNITHEKNVINKEKCIMRGVI